MFETRIWFDGDRSSSSDNWITKEGEEWDFISAKSSGEGSLLSISPFGSSTSNNWSIIPGIDLGLAGRFEEFES